MTDRQSIYDKNFYFSGKWECQFTWKETGEIRPNPFKRGTDIWQGYHDAALEIQQNKKVN